MQPYQLNPEIESQFNSVNNYILHHLESNVPLVEKIGHYIVSGGGKRLRPLLVLLAANATGYSGENHIKLAAIIEFIHTATLLHDDVVDNSDLRRGKDTANTKWGNAPSVLVGDFLYSRAFQIMVEINSLDIMKIIANSTNLIAEGEVLQMLNTKNPDTTEDAYMQVIIGKTATLFETATEAGALLSNSTPEVCEALRLYGRYLGTAFQLIDDVMDYQSTAENMGKNIGDDLAEGKTTLPLIHAMREGNEQQRSLIRQAIRKGGLDDLQPIIEIVKQTGAIDYTKQKAQQQADCAKNYLDILPDSSFKTTLEQLTATAADRTT